MYKISGLLIATVIFYGCSSTKVNSAKNTPMVTSADNTVSEQEKNNGWQLLFDGSTTNGWHTYGKQTVGNAWKISDGALHLDPSASDRGDIVTDDEFDNFAEVAKIVGLGEIVKIDNTLLEIADLPEGFSAHRKFKGDKWIIQELEQETEE